MEKAIRVLDDAAKSLKSEIRVWTKQGDFDVVKKCKEELQQINDAIRVLSKTKNNCKMPNVSENIKKDCDTCKHRYLPDSKYPCRECLNCCDWEQTEDMQKDQCPKCGSKKENEDDELCMYCA